MSNPARTFLHLSQTFRPFRSRMKKMKGRPRPVYTGETSSNFPFKIFYLRAQERDRRTWRRTLRRRRRRRERGSESPVVWWDPWWPTGPTPPAPASTRPTPPSSPVSTTSPSPPYRQTTGPWSSSPSSRDSPVSLASTTTDTPSLVCRDPRPLSLTNTTTSSGPQTPKMTMMTTTMILVMTTRRGRRRKLAQYSLEVKWVEAVSQMWTKYYICRFFNWSQHLIWRDISRAVREPPWQLPCTWRRPRSSDQTTASLGLTSPHSSGQDLVPEPPEQMEETVGGRHGGCQPRWWRRSSGSPSPRTPGLCTSTSSLHASPRYQDGPPDSR